MENTYLTGNTVRLTGTFKDINGALRDPSFVKVILYNYRYEKIEEFILGTVNKVGTGVYAFDYRTPNDEMKIYYEFYGEIEGNPAIQRSSFKTKFII
jgi:hypothetical protein